MRVWGARRRPRRPRIDDGTGQGGPAGNPGVAAARVESVTPTRGSLEGGSLVTVRGSGFVDTEYARCKFYSNSTAASEVLYSSMTYISSTEVICPQPAATMESLDASFLDVALDGQLFSPTEPPAYQIIGEAKNLSSTSDFTVSATPTSGNGNSINLTMEVWVVDKQVHRLLEHFEQTGAS